MIKRILGVVLALVLSLSFASAVAADAIVIPEDSFSTAHDGELVYCYRTYTSAKDISVYVSPEDKTETGTIAAREPFVVNFTYTTDEVEWGVLEAGEWLLMEGLTVKYDNISFMEDYKDRIKDFTNEFSSEGHEQLVFWTYPGSSEYIAVPVDNSVGFDKVYVNADGGIWCYTPYFRQVEGWVYVNAPESKKQVVLNLEVSEGVSSPVVKNHNYTWTVVAIVAALTAAAGTAIVIVYKKKK